MINNKYFKNEVFNNNSIVEIPKDWEVKKTGDLLNGVVGTTPPKKDPNNFIGNLEWINISDMGSYLINSEKTVNRNAKGVKNRIIEKNSLLYSFKLSVGEIGFNKNEAMTNEAIISFSPSKNKNVNLKYFYYVLKKYLHLNAGANVYGAPIMNQEKIKDADLIVTEDIKEQNKIVEILDQQQSLIDSYNKKLSLLEEQESYYQDELLSGRIRIKLNSENEQIAIDKGFIVNGELVEGKEKEFEEWLSLDFKDKVEFYKEEDFLSVNLNNRHYKLPKDWKIEKISDIFDVSRGKVLSKLYIQENKGVYPVYSSATENNGVIGNIDTYMYDGEYLTWTTDGIYAGKIFYRNGKFSATNVCGVLKLKNEGYNYNIIKFFAQPFFNINVNKVGNNKLMSNIVSDIEFLLPKVSIEQYLLNNFFNNINENKNIILEKIKIEEEKMDYLMDELLSGRIRVE